MEKISIRDAVRTFGKSDSYFRKLQREWKVSKPKAVFMYEGKVYFDLNELNKKFNQISVNTKPNYNQEKNDKLLAILERQLDEQNKQINHLNETIKAQTVMIHNLTESVKLIEQNKPKRKRWFW